MAECRFCFLWDNHSQLLSSKLRKLYEEQLFVDVYIYCEEQTIGVHKCVLAAGSSYFQNQLQEHFESDLIVMHSIDLITLKSILEFLYRGEVNVREERVDAILEAARYLKISGLCGLDSEKVGAPDVLRDSSEWIFPEFLIRKTATLCENSIENVTLSTNEYVCAQDVAFPTQFFSAPTLVTDNLQDVLKSDAEIEITVNNVLHEVLEDEKNKVALESSAVINTEKNREKIENEVVSQLTSIIDNEEVPLPDTISGSVPAASEEIIYEEEHLEDEFLEDQIVLEGGDDPLYESVVDNNEYESPPVLPTEVEPDKAMQVLQEAGVPTDVPIYCEGSDGSYVQLTKDVLAEIASGGQVIYQVVDEEGKAGELLLGTAVKQNKSPQKIGAQTPMNIVYDRLVADAIHSVSTTPTPNTHETVTKETSTPITSEPIVESVITTVLDTTPLKCSNTKLVVKDASPSEQSSGKPVRNRKLAYAVSSEFVTPRTSRARKRKIPKIENNNSEPVNVTYNIESKITENKIPDSITPLKISPCPETPAPIADTIEQRIAELHMETNDVQIKSEQLNVPKSPHETENGISIVKLAALKRKRIFKSTVKKKDSDGTTSTSDVEGEVAKPKQPQLKSKKKMNSAMETRLRQDSSSDTSGQSTSKEIPYALGLLPLKKALRKIQNMPDHTPRRTRSNIIPKSEERELIGDRGMESTNSENRTKKVVDVIIKPCRVKINLLPNSLLPKDAKKKFVKK